MMAKLDDDDVSDRLRGQAELLRLKRFSELDLDRLVVELWAQVEETSHRLWSALVPLLTDLLVWAYRPDWQAEVCQTPPVKMTWCPLRRAPWTLSGLRGTLTREPVGDLHVLPGDDDCPDQARRHGLAFFKGEPVQVVTQQAPKGFGRLNDLLPRPRLLLGAGSWRAFRLALRHLRGEFQPPRVSCAQADPLSLIGVQSALAWPRQALPALQEVGWLRGEG